MTYQDDDFILVGNFGRPIGLKGSIKLNSFTRPPENIESYNSFFMKECSQFVELEVKKITTSGKNLIIFLNNCNSLEEAEKNNKDIFLIAQKDANVDDPGENDIYRVGTIANILQLLKLPDGTVTVTPALIAIGPAAIAFLSVDIV